MKIYHNPRCSKSNMALELIKQNGIEPEIIDYMRNPPSKEELTAILDMLKMSPFEIVRKNEPIFKEKFAGQHLTDEQWLDILLEHPKLIERPIVIHGSKAMIARPLDLAKLI